jgi:hypothetical protein
LPTRADLQGWHLWKTLRDADPNVCTADDLPKF